MALYLKKLGIGLAMLVALWLALAFFSSPAWAQAELTVNKTGDPRTVVAGQEVTYTIDVINSGNEDARNVTLTDKLPNEFNFVSANSTNGNCVEGGGTAADPDVDATCNLGPLAVGEVATVTVVATATQVGTFPNEASASSPDVDPPVSDTANTRVVPNLDIDKLDDRDPINVGSNILYTLRVINQGSTPVAAGDVVVIDDLPIDEVRLVDVSSNSFDCNPLDPPTGRIRCVSSVELGPGESASIKITVDPDEAGEIENIAEVRFDGFAVDMDVESTVVAGDTVDLDPNGPGEEPDVPGEDPGVEGVAGDQYGDTNIINIPGKNLPNTGGPPLLAIFFSVVAGAGLLTAVVRRRY